MERENSGGKILGYIFLAGIVALPFNNLPYLRTFLGELSNEGAFYFFFPFVAVAAIFSLRRKSGGMSGRGWGWIFMPFLLLAGGSLFANYTHVMQCVFKSRSGWEKYVFQLGVILFGYSLSFSIFSVFGGNFRPLITILRRGVILSFVPVCVYSAFEMLYLLGLLSTNLLSGLERFFHDVGALQYFRLRSVSGEPSYFAMYLTFGLPFFLQGLFYEMRCRALYYAGVFYIALMVFLTYSRSAYIIFSVQPLMFLVGLFLFGDLPRVRVLRIFVAFLVVSGLAYLCVNTCANKGYNPVGTFRSVPYAQEASGVYGDEFKASNQIRGISQHIATRLGRSAPWFGIGLGQYGFYFSNSLDIGNRSAIEGETIRVLKDAASDTVGSGWPPVYSLLHRIFAEMGWSGLVSWTFIWASMIFFIIKTLRCGASSSNALLVLFLNFAVLPVMLIHDSFRFMPYWIVMGVNWVYLSESEVKLIW